MTDESREIQEPRKLPGWATECVAVSPLEKGTQQEGWGGGHPCFVAAREL